MLAAGFIASAVLLAGCTGPASEPALTVAASANPTASDESIIEPAPGSPESAEMVPEGESEVDRTEDSLTAESSLVSDARAGFTSTGGNMSDDEIRSAAQRACDLAAEGAPANEIIVLPGFDGNDPGQSSDNAALIAVAREYVCVGVIN